MFSDGLSSVLWAPTSLAPGLGQHRFSPGLEVEDPETEPEDDAKCCRGTALAVLEQARGDLWTPALVDWRSSQTRQKVSAVP